MCHCGHNHSSWPIERQNLYAGFRNEIPVEYWRKIPSDCRVLSSDISVKDFFHFQYGFKPKLVLFYLLHNPATTTDAAQDRSKHDWRANEFSAHRPHRIGRSTSICRYK